MKSSYIVTLDKRKILELKIKYNLKDKHLFIYIPKYKTTIIHVLNMYTKNQLIYQKLLESN